MLKSLLKFPSVIEQLARRSYSEVQQAMAKTLSFPEVKEKLNSEKTILLDVREKGELTSDGKIHGSNNVPVGEVAKAFALNDGDFQATYGFEKPKPSDDIVIHCKAGVRAQKAAQVLMGSGYRNVQVYSGISDWVQNGGQVEK